MTKQDPISLREKHAAVLAISSLILAFPYSIPEWMPATLECLASCVHDSNPIGTAAALAFREFKRTHQDSWNQDKLKFSEQELYAVSEILYSASYFA